MSSNEKFVIVENSGEDDSESGVKLKEAESYETQAVKEDQ